MISVWLVVFPVFFSNINAVLTIAVQMWRTYEAWDCRSQSLKLRIFPSKVFSLRFISLSMPVMMTTVCHLWTVFSTNFIDINPGKERCSIRSLLTAASAKTNYQNRSSSHEKGADAGLTSSLIFIGLSKYLLPLVMPLLDRSICNTLKLALKLYCGSLHWLCSSSWKVVYLL